MTEPNPKNPAHPAEYVIDLASAYWKSGVLFGALRLDLFNVIDHDELSLSEVAQRLNCTERILEMLLNACVSLDLLSKQNEKYSLNDTSKLCLHKDGAANLSQAIQFNMYNYSVWDTLAEAVRQDQTQEKEDFHLGEDKEKTRQFVYSMHYRVLGMGQEVAAKLDLSGCKQLLDVGGGPGTYSMLMLKRNPDLQSTVIDLPGIAEVGQDIVASEGLSDRLSYHPGSYREVDFPGEKDALLLFGMMHQETAESCKNLIKKAFDALKPGGKLAVMDLMLDEDKTGPQFSTLFALTMALTHSTGWVFSRDELKAWLGEAGFVDVTNIPLSPLMPHELYTAKKPD